MHVSVCVSDRVYFILNTQYHLDVDPLTLVEY